MIGERGVSRTHPRRVKIPVDPFVWTYAAGIPPAHALEHLDSGTAYWSKVSDLVAGQRPEPERVEPAPAEPLTERELTVLRYLQSILSNLEIAAELSLSVNTVKTHVRNIYRKLEATGRRDAVRRARGLRLL
jgi:LuxR family maltose regulon positive regulatory protein